MASCRSVAIVCSGSGKQMTEVLVYSTEENSNGFRQARRSPSKHLLLVNRSDPVRTRLVPLQELASNCLCRRSARKIGAP